MFIKLSRVISHSVSHVTSNHMNFRYRDIFVLSKTYLSSRSKQTHLLLFYRFQIIQISKFNVSFSSKILILHHFSTISSNVDKMFITFVILIFPRYSSSK